MVPYMLLDDGIRSGVLVPIVLVVVCAALLRINIMQLLKAENPVNLRDLHATQVAASATRLRTNGKYVPERQFLTRRLHLNKKDVGVLWKPPPQPNALQALAASQSDPSQMFGALKSQFAFLALNGGLGLIISFFFSGFLVGSFSPSSSNCRRLLQQGHSSSIVAAAVVVMAVLLLW
eukprot:GHVU01129546.1.p1 GENE.GHVU01129546.1~~GHVU01129546.1.p1  ORF type:complete len:177 (+),score=33.13 GHVU01129546.1:376-906(+)